LIFISIVFDIAVLGIFIPLSFIKISKGLDRVLQFQQFDSILSKVTGIFFIVLGLILIIRAYYLIVKIGRGYTLEFFRKKLLPVTKNLVRIGPYSKIRHPMALGYLIMLLGLIFILGSLSGLFILLPLTFIMAALYLSIFEEKALLGRFGEEFAKYKSETNLLIPCLKKEVE